MAWLEEKFVEGRVSWAAESQQEDAGPAPLTCSQGTSFL